MHNMVKRRGGLAMILVTSAWAGLARGDTPSGRSGAPSTIGEQALESLPPPDDDHGGAQRALAIGVGAVGIAAIGVGVAFGLSARGHRDDARGHCDDRNACDPVGFTALEDGRRAAAISTISVGAGLAGVVTGAILYATAPRDALKGQLHIQPDRVVFGISGDF
jgi:hypothetical protein